MDGLDFPGLGTGISQSLSRRRTEGKVAKHSSTAAIHKMRPRFRCSLQPFGRITICYIVQFESLPDDSCDCVNRTRLPGTRTRKFMSARIRRQDSVSSDVCSPFDFFRIHSWPPKGITLTSPSPGDPRTRWSIKAGSRFDAPITMPPIREQNCFRLSSPETNRVSDRRRAPSPPTRITTPAMFLHMTPLSQADARDTSFSPCLMAQPNRLRAAIVHRGSSALPPVTTSRLVPQGAD